MTVKRDAQHPSGLVEFFPLRPPRKDMQNWIHIGIPGHLSALSRHLGSRDTTIVICEPALGWNLSQRRGLLYPDLLVAFNANRAHAFARLGYAMDVQGKPPEFVLEVGSPRTALNDYTTKREGYAAFGVQEYWRYDPTGGDRYPVGLAGDRLVGGEYQAIPVYGTKEVGYWGHSDALNLDLCWEHGQLRWYDPVAQRYLRTYEEEAEGRIAAEADAAEAQARVRQLEEELRRRAE